jgi:hypothetical protein
MSDVRGFPNKFINQYSAIDSIISFIDDLKESESWRYFKVSIIDQRP